MRQLCGLYRENKQQASKLKANVGKGVWEMVDSNDHLLLENSFMYFDKSKLVNPYHTTHESS